MSTIPFWKMHGAGNDFILFDDRTLATPTDPAQLSAWMERRFGVGSDGSILIQTSDRAAFRMRFFNPDGREAEMCANGARCVARLAFDLGVAPEEMTIETAAGDLAARMIGDQVELGMMPPTDWVLERELALDGTTVSYSSLNTGVPHVVIDADDVASLDVAAAGQAIRRHEAFAPAGTNVNFCDVVGPAALHVRTYERGVEAETLACGTGVTACALLVARRGLVSPPVEVTCRSGSVLVVDFALTDAGADQVTLLGPAEYVFEGSLRA